MENKLDDSDPNVTLFGENIKDDANHHHFWRESHNCYDSRKCGSPFGGVLFIFVGLLLLFNTIGLVSFNFWDHVFKFWPILLVLIGIRIFLGHNIVSNLVVLILSIIFFGFISIYGMIQVNSPLLNYLPPEIIQQVNSINQFNNK
jgi:hypothetical protein